VEVWKQAAYWIEVLRSDWNGETPQRIHSRDVAPDGSPALHPEFARWLFAADAKPNRPFSNPEERLRTTRAFRKLRKQAPREFDVLYLMVVHEETLPAITRALNDRAIRLGKDDRYSTDDVRILLISGLDKVVKWR
jgi:hypothetical protein